MKMFKQLSLVLLAGVVASFSTACSWWENGSEEEISQFYQPDDGMARSGKADTAANKDGDFVDLAGMQGKENDGKDGVDAWGKDLNGGQDAAANGGAAYTDGFGARIANVNFEPVYFLFDQNVIRQSEEYKLKAVADYLKSNAKAGIVIEGNCDSRGTTEYNRVLGEKRAIAAKTFLMNQGIAESRIKTISYGEERPAVQGDTEESRAQNRRDELVPVYLLK